ncbi:hypothetical protein ABOM_000814 [Aspergillus bombycis]|uniref:Zn(2)-C6 fungal-type domain-containing protein n=1 Tax=Aspergillus bombycis TaxID=109264 RepID=A0A1F8AH21_9EURO|nr:hypothetical protein ABOM_000814 [Aspergillus bombycis]OGM50598.1 hypothetical protein ABOM_000814 [Aspergillus bombycis]
MAKRKRQWSPTRVPSQPVAGGSSPNVEQQQSPFRIPQSNHTSERNPQQEPGETAVAPPLVEVLPSITRKITACAACRKNKIRCDMPEDGPPCIRCRRRSLSCVLNRSLQSLVEDVKNVELVQSDLRNLHDTVNIICQHLDLGRPKPLVTGHRKAREDIPASGEPDREESEGCEVSPPDSPSAVQAPIDTFLDIAKLGSPKSVESPPGRRASRATHGDDLITKGIVSVAVAEQLLHRYFSRLDHYLYGICSEHHDLQQLRTTSPILLAAICTVSALHDPQDQKYYAACNREFRSLVMRSLFEKRDVEYLRALCIASFWLADASRILCSDAIRRTADIRLHRSFDYLIGARDPESCSPSAANPTTSVDRVRLWYLLFVCDQHLSILHNRDSLLRSDKDIAVSWETYLHRAETTESDVRILSQVSLLLIMGQVRDVLGSDNQTQLPPTLTHHITNYSRQLDKWFAKFSALFITNAYIGDFPRKGLELHYQFGKLYLGHQVFKGLHGNAIPMHFVSAANMAHDAAVGIYEMILNDSQLKNSLVGMPHYFHIMIAFAGHLLLEICHNHHEQLSINVQDEFHLISAVLDLLRNQSCIPQHPIRRMAPGLSRKLAGCAASLGINSLSDNHPAIQNTYLATAGGQSFADTTQPFDKEPVQFPVDSTAPQMDDFLFGDIGEFTFPDLTSSFLP